VRPLCHILSGGASNGWRKLEIKDLSPINEDPQSLNRYAYARSDPLGRSEMGGMFWVCVDNPGLTDYLHRVLDKIGVVLTCTYYGAGASTHPGYNTGMAAAAQGRGKQAQAQAYGTAVSNLKSGLGPLENAMDHLKPACQNILNGLGVTADQVKTAAQTVLKGNIFDGRGSSEPVISLLPSGTKSYQTQLAIDAALGRPQTIGEVQGADLIARLGGPGIGVLRPDVLNMLSKPEQFGAKLMHEVLHNLGLEDDFIMTTLGLSPQNDPRAAIDQLRLKPACF
jgi:hypothetical protein